MRDNLKQSRGTREPHEAVASTPRAPSIEGILVDFLQWQPGIMDTVVNTYLKAVVGHLRAQSKGLEEWEGLCDEKLDPR